jgi:hypothetical protein
MDIVELVQKSVDEWNKKNKEAFLTHFTERSEITGPDGAALHGLQGVEMFWEVWQGAFSITRAPSATSSQRDGISAGTAGRDNVVNNAATPQLSC